jgi:endonuclease III
MRPSITFRKTIAVLEKHYGRPKPPRVTDPFEMVLWESVTYLGTDERRAAAFAALKKRVGTKPQDILNASDAALLEICSMGGIVPKRCVQKLRRAAEIAHWIFKDDVRAALKQAPAKAKAAMKKFQGFGGPGAERVLLYNHVVPVLALDSNGLRVLRRVGYGEEMKNYSATYRAVQEALADQLPKDIDVLIRAHQLLRQHGKELCKTSRPLCDDCPLTKDCAYSQSLRK